MAEEKESFVFYKSFYEALQDLKDRDRLKVYDAICNMALKNTETELTGIAKTIFTLIKPQVLANNRRYENGKKGGRPNNKTIGYQKNKTIGYEKEETKTKPNVNDNVNVNDITTAVVGESCIDGLQETIDFYNNNIGAITPYGADILSDYLKTMDKDLLILAMKKSVESNKRTIKYIKGILNNWTKKGIKTLVEAEQEDFEFKNKNKPKEETHEEELERKLKEIQGGNND